MKQRIKKSLALVIQSRAEAETSVNLVAGLINERRAVAAELDAKTLELKSEYDLELAGLDVQIKRGFEDLEAWAIANPDEFGKQKSIEFLAGTVGFRTGTPKLVPLNRKWTWEKITAAVQQWLPNFIRSKPEVDKAAIISQRDELSAFLPSVGLQVTQGETFYVEPNLTAED
jgi:phage host-nuclease inhibitor protein Gam